MRWLETLNHRTKLLLRAREELGDAIRATQDYEEAIEILTFAA
jgi:hypothetical protein